VSGAPDVVVVGAGSTGGTLAARLSEEPGLSVLLLEAGRDFPDEATNPPSFLTGGSLSGENGAGSGPPVPEYDWGYRSETLPGGRFLSLPRGKVVGGSGMTNGCVAVRGRPEDFGRWEAAGATGWGWDDVLPYFRVAERELNVHTYPPELWLPVQHLVLDACRELGFRWEDDLNAPDAWDGVVGPWPRSRRNEMRLGSLNTYVRAARGRPNFEVRGHALVDRVLVENGRAVGVAYVDADGRRREVQAGRVVVSAGAYGSAPILLRSGIGPADELRSLGIEPLVDLPVGRQLMEHPGILVKLEVAREHARMGWPTLAAVARGHGWWGIPMPCDEERGHILLGLFLALTEGPEGGAIRLTSPSPDAAPAIDHGYVGAIDGGLFEGVLGDLEALLGTSVFEAAGVRDLQAGTPARQRLLDRVTCGQHSAGGCAIGPVVDSGLAVHGVEQLHVADASVFPRHVTNNPNLTCFVVGELFAKMLAGVDHAGG